MNAVQFPNMIYHNKTNIVKGDKATEQNLVYLIHSMKKEMLGDPYFGVNLERLMFERNNGVLRDLIIDDLFTAISLFMPQLRVERRNIRIESDKTEVKAYIKAQNRTDFSFSDYQINLLNIEELV